MSGGHGGGGGGHGPESFVAQWILAPAMGLAMAYICIAFVVKEIAVGCRSAWNSVTSAFDFSEVRKPAHPFAAVQRKTNVVCGGTANEKLLRQVAQKLGVDPRPEFGAAFQAIAEMESGSSYDAQGPVMAKGMYKGDRALGKYQVMGNNLDEWSTELLGVGITSSCDAECLKKKFVANHDFQDAIAYGRITKYWKEAGNIKDVAAMWQSGGSYADAKESGVGDGITKTTTYAKDVERLYEGYLAQCTVAFAASDIQLACPMKGGMKMSGYEMRENPITGEQEFHHGVDLSGNPDKTNYAAAPGTVEYAGNAGDGFGYKVVLNHGIDKTGKVVRTLYGHNAKLLVHKGDSVVAGQAVGVTGKTGDATGVHLHFTVEQGGTLNKNGNIIKDSGGNPVDPMPFLTKLGCLRKT